MLLSAQRVRSRHGVTGINVYVYRHPPGAWDPSSLEALERGAGLELQELEVPPGGNDVRSYLDLFAPEGTSSSELARVTAVIRSGPDPSSFPAVFEDGPIVIRLGLVFGLVPSWRNELTDLVSRVLLSAEAHP